MLFTAPPANAFHKNREYASQECVELAFPLARVRLCTLPSGKPRSPAPARILLYFPRFGGRFFLLVYVFVHSRRGSRVRLLLLASCSIFPHELNLIDALCNSSLRGVFSCSCTSLYTPVTKIHRALSCSVFRASVGIFAAGAAQRSIHFFRNDGFAVNSRLRKQSIHAR